MKKWWLLSILFILIVLCAIALVIIPGPNIAKAPTDGVATSTPASLDDLIVVTSPLPNAHIGPATVSIMGKARGNWYFEASFPIELKNSSGTVIAQTHGQAQSDWMTTDFVLFTATLTFPAQPAGSPGTVVLKNDNPSGDPAKDKELDIPVVF